MTERKDTAMTFRRTTTLLLILAMLLTALLPLTSCTGGKEPADTSADTSADTTADTVPATTPSTTPGTAPETLPETEEPKVTLTFDGNGAAQLTLTLPASAATVTLPDDPTREGFAFKGWYTEKDGGDRVTNATPLNGEATYYARWAEVIDMSHRNHIRIGGFNGITESNAVESDFEALAACGVDEIYMTFFHDDSGDGKYSLEKSLQYMAWMEKYGIQCWYNDFKLNELLKNHAPAEECMALLSVYKDSPSFIGNYLADEPAGDRFDELVNTMNYYKELMPDNQMYVNLLPNFAPTGAFIEGSFAKYVQAFVERFPCTYVSQDFYPIDIKVKGRKAVSKEYYASLLDEACAARDGGKDSWMYIYTMRDTVNAVKDYEPSLTDVRFEANTALAYGNCSIAYYCFDCPPSYAKSESYGMLKNHERTPLFDTGVQLTKEIKALSDVFPKYLWQNVGYLSSTTRFKNLVSRTLTPAADLVAHTVTTDGDLLIGIFEEANGDGMAYMFAHQIDLNEPAPAAVSITIPEAIRVVAHIGTETVELQPAEGGVYSFTLSDGLGCFLEICR